MEAISLIPHYIHIGEMMISQTLIASLIGTSLFGLLTIIYLVLKHYREDNFFVLMIDNMIEQIYEFYKSIAGEHMSSKLVGFVVFIFFYILRSNLIGLIGDLIVLVVPSLHHYFRPVSTDLFFNMVIAGFCVVGTFVYGFQKNGLHYIEKYIPYKGFGIVPEVKNLVTALLKPLDILIGLFIGMVEFLGECAKVLSLSLRLFGNILAGMVLLGLIVTGAQAMFGGYALGLPILVIILETFVGVLQAFVFSMLCLVYFKMAGESHH